MSITLFLNPFYRIPVFLRKEKRCSSNKSVTQTIKHSNNRDANHYKNFIYLLVSGQRKRHMIKVMSLTAQTYKFIISYANLRTKILLTHKLYSNTFKLRRNPCFIWCLIGLSFQNSYRGTTVQSGRSHRNELTLWLAAKELLTAYRSAAQLLIKYYHLPGRWDRWKRCINHNKCGIRVRALLALLRESLYFDGRKRTLVKINGI